MREKLPLVPERTVELGGGSRFTHLSVLDMTARQLHLATRAHFVPRKGAREPFVCMRTKEF
jgi:hypothetical protein